MAQSFQIIFALAIIIALFMYLPQLIAFGTGDFASGGTLLGNVSGATGIIAVSYDGGDTFKQAEVRTAGAPNILKIETPDGGAGAFAARTYYAGTDAGLLISKDDGLTWHPFSDLEKNIDSGTVLYDFAFHPFNGASYAAGTKNGHGVIFVTKDDFFTADILWNEPNMLPRSVAVDANFLYFGLSDGRLLRYSLIQKTFEKVNTFNGAVLALNLMNDGRTIYAALDSGDVFTSDDFGTKWADVREANGFGSFAGLGGRTIAFTPDKNNTAILYLASTAGIFRSANRGGNWNTLETIMPDDARVAALAVENGAIFVTSGGRLYESMDGGANWKIKEPMATSKRLGTLYTGNGGQIVMVGATK